MNRYMRVGRIIRRCRWSWWHWCILAWPRKQYRCNSRWSMGRIHSRMQVVFFVHRRHSQSALPWWSVHRQVWILDIGKCWSQRQSRYMFLQSNVCWLPRKPARFLLILIFLDNNPLFCKIGFLKVTNINELFLIRSKDYLLWVHQRNQKRPCECIDISPQNH